jgi:hypothetical protein
LHAGGDWCQVIPIAPGMAALTIGDVSGHATTAAAAMAALRTTVVDAIAEVRLPSAALARANEAAYGFAGGTIATAIVAFIDEREQTLTFANAGHPPPLMVTPFGHAFMAAGVADIPLGIFPVHRPADCVIALPPDALLVFYTDGITEHRRNPVDGERGLIEAARAVYARPARGSRDGMHRGPFVNGRSSAHVPNERTGDDVRPGAGQEQRKHEAIAYEARVKRFHEGEGDQQHRRDGEHSINGNFGCGGGFRRRWVGGPSRGENRCRHARGLRGGDKRCHGDGRVVGDDGAPVRRNPVGEQHAGNAVQCRDEHRCGSRRHIPADRQGRAREHVPVASAGLREHQRAGTLSGSPRAGIAGAPSLARMSRNGLTMSSGIGKMVVVSCSAPISCSVCK